MGAESFLAVVLARAQQFDLAEKQAKRCFAEIDEPRLRSLSTASLYHLLVMGKAFKLGIANPQLRQLALDLLPPDSRAKVM